MSPSFAASEEVLFVSLLDYWLLKASQYRTEPTDSSQYARTIDDPFLQKQSLQAIRESSQIFSSVVSLYFPRAKRITPSGILVYTYEFK